MSKFRDIVKGNTPATVTEPITAPADAAVSKTEEFHTAVLKEKADQPSDTQVVVDTAPPKPAEVTPEASPPAPEPASDRASIADLQKAAREGREFEISKAVSWAPDYVPGTGIYVDGVRRYSATAAHNDSAIETLASDDRYLVRLV